MRTQAIRTRSGNRQAEVIGKLRTIEVELARGQSARQACRKVGVTEQTD